MGLDGSNPRQTPIPQTDKRKVTKARTESHLPLTLSHDAYWLATYGASSASASASASSAVRIHTGYAHVCSRQLSKAAMQDHHPCTPDGTVKVFLLVFR